MPAASLAEHYRAHRAAFDLALEMGCTPKEAAMELRRRAAIEREQACLRRMAAKDAALAPRAAQSEWDAPWMLRN